MEIFTDSAETQNLEWVDAVSSDRKTSETPVFFQVGGLFLVQISNQPK